MTDKAVIGLPDEGWGRTGILLTERVEDGTKHRIDGRQLKDIPLLAVAHIDFVVEIQCSWSTRGDATQLQTGFGKHQRLRLKRNLQLLQ